VTVGELRERFDAVVLATGSRVPRDLPVPGRELGGVHFAMDYLYQRNRWVAREHGPEPTVPQPSAGEPITAAGKHVVVIGGGDTGADCVGNSLREGALSIVQLELLPKPPDHRPDERTPWPEWPLKYRLSYAMEETENAGVGEQDYSVLTTHFSGDEHGNVAALHIAQAEPAPPFGRVPGTERELPAQLVLLAMGFLHPEQALIDQLGVEKDPRGNVKAVKPYTTSVEGVFAAGDARRGQSLIVWAINEGRQCARMVDRHLAGLLADRGSRRSSIGGSPVRGHPGGRRQAADGALPQDEGLAGHADADEGPEGPPQHVGPGMPAERSPGPRR